MRTNVAFERKGSVLTSQTTDINGNPLGEITVNTNFNYLTLPILLRATFGKKFHYFINAGPYFGYLIKQNFVSQGDNFPVTTSDNTSLIKRFDTGISTGLGLSVPIKTAFAFSFEVRNNLGLYNVSAVPVANMGTIKTNSTNLLLGFTYKLGQRTSDTK
ncbi:PorT family protein [Lewinella lacunae]|uniref:PorT family protein n=1 Tax=Neolewinella lacunae TaxID=1517758 RepID=A0A923PM64_9BACT|nr:PorT family protein [Neolewinella lacunae]MBC6995256.1 PorT family protein [Neolewinella lacunae]